MYPNCFSFWITFWAPAGAECIAAHAYNRAATAYRQFKGLRSLLKEASLSYGQPQNFFVIIPVS